MPQRPHGTGAMLLQDMPGELVRIQCDACGRWGQYAYARLVERFGPAAGLPDVLSALAGGCPRRGAGQYSDPCGARFLRI